MEKFSKKENWGGARPGAGRKPGLRAVEKKTPRQITLPPGLWARIDAAQEEKGLTRTGIFEEMAEAWLAANESRCSDDL